jgi:hypothetical protein
MKHEVRMRLDHPPAAVIAGLVDARFQLEKWRRLGALSVDLLDEGGQGSIRFLTIRRRIGPKLSIPAALKRLLPTQAEFIHREEWDLDGAVGRIDIDLGALPLRVHGASRILAGSGGSEQCFEWQIHASIPVLGGALERFIAENLTRDVLAEARVMNALLQARA